MRNPSTAANTELSKRISKRSNPTCLGLPKRRRLHPFSAAHYSAPVQRTSFVLLLLADRAARLEQEAVAALLQSRRWEQSRAAAWQPAAFCRLAVPQLAWPPCSASAQLVRRGDHSSFRPATAPRCSHPGISCRKGKDKSINGVQSTHNCKKEPKVFTNASDPQCQLSCNKSVPDSSHVEIDVEDEEDAAVNVAHVRQQRIRRLFAWKNSGVRVGEEVTRDAVVRGASEPTEKGTVSGSQEGKLALTSSQPNRSQSRRQTLLKWHVECERSCSKLVLIEYCREGSKTRKSAKRDM